MALPQVICPKPLPQPPPPPNALCVIIYKWVIIIGTYIIVLLYII